MVSHLFSLHITTRWLFALFTFHHYSHFHLSAHLEMLHLVRSAKQLKWIVTSWANLRSILFTLCFPRVEQIPVHYCTLSPIPDGLTLFCNYLRGTLWKLYLTEKDSLLKQQMLIECWDLHKERMIPLYFI